jgi:hypothetical protein
MPTNDFPNIGKKTQGKDFNFFKKVTVTAADFGSGSVTGVQPDIIITFPTAGIIILNEGTASTNSIEFSFNGNTVHGELDPSTPSKGLSFDNRTVSMIWFRLKAGSVGPVTIQINAWGNP